MYITIKNVNPVSCDVNSGVLVLPEIKPCAIQFLRKYAGIMELRLSIQFNRQIFRSSLFLSSYGGNCIKSRNENNSNGFVR